MNVTCCHGIYTDIIKEGIEHVLSPTKVQSPKLPASQSPRSESNSVLG